MFVGRERELASLKEFYDKDGIGLTIVYGRRRIGKSTLITEFVKDKKTIFLYSDKSWKEQKPGVIFKAGIGFADAWNGRYEFSYNRGGF